MSAAIVDQIAKAVLYEGYMLYPYRPSAVKNRQRFNFGVVYPGAYSQAQGGTDVCTLQSECLLRASEEAQCRVRVRFLRIVERSVGTLVVPVRELGSIGEENLQKMEKLEVNGRVYQPWREAVEETVEVTEFTPWALAGQSMQWPFRLSARQEKEAIRDEGGLIAGMIWRDKASISGAIDLTAVGVKPDLFKLTVRISNDSPLTRGSALNREQALAQSLISTHIILEAGGGEFISLLDPPEEYRDFAMACQNVGAWPVLVGEGGQRDTMLCSPIILYDYPQIAPESPGDLFDSAEIDEILSLRIMTLTEEEKAEIRQSDDRARQILERTESLPEEHFRKLHGALRGMRPVDPPGGRP